MKKPKPFRIFRVGTHTDSAGNATTFTREQLAATVLAYNEGEWRAPLVAGHPKGNAPAYGWVGKMRLEENGDVFVDDVEKLNTEFAELMESGAYRNRSASWYAPDHPSNPTPGVWQLRHLGMLGAQPPALKGLGDVEFHDGEGVLLNFDDQEDAWNLANFMRNAADTISSFRDWIIGEKGLEEADKRIPKWQVDNLLRQSIQQEERARNSPDNTVPSFHEPITPESTTMTPEEIAALQAQAAKATKLEADLNAEKAARTAAETQLSSFAEQDAKKKRAAVLVDVTTALQPVVTAGKLLPAQVAPIAEFMADLDETKTFDFGEHTGEKGLTPRAMFLQLLAAAPTQVDYSEQTGAVDMPANLSPTDLAARAVEYREAQAGKGIVITTAAAIDAVIAGKNQ